MSIITTDNRRQKVMARTVRARMRGGMLELLEKVETPEGKEVSVTILERPTPRDPETEGRLEALRANYELYQKTTVFCDTTPSA
jgi:hypothetical protein